MARISRLVVPGYPHHVTQRGVRSIPIFSNDKDRSAYADIMAEQLHRFGVEVLAWCLMTNHTHLVAVPKDQAALARTGDMGSDFYIPTVSERLLQEMTRLARIVES